MSPLLGETQLVFVVNDLLILNNVILLCYTEVDANKIYTTIYTHILR